VCQDIFISKLTDVDFLSSKVVFKGGIVMYELTKGKRGYTKDIDFDFIHYTVSDEGINDFIQVINSSLRFDNIKVIIESTEKLIHKNYRGNRVFLDFVDNSKTHLKLSIDIGVHTDKISQPTVRPYEIRFSDEKVDILIDSNELSIVEKLSTFALYGTDNSRYRDLFDAYWRLKYIDYDINLVKKIFDDQLVFSGYFKTRMHAIKVINHTLVDSRYLAELIKEKNWTEDSVETICHDVLDFLSILSHE
jgi:hypothetical protein